MEIPTRDTLNTSATPMCFCVSRQERDTRCVMLNRFCAYGAFPELRSSTTSADTSEEVRSEKGGDTTIHSQVTTRVQMGDDTAPDGVVSEDTINGLPSECQSSTDDNEGDQGLIQVPCQGSDSEGNEQQGLINDVTPVALRTRRRLQTAPIRIDRGEGELEQDTIRNEDKELIRQLTTQNKELQQMIDELSSALKDFLKVQSIVKKTERDLAKISKQVKSREEFKVMVSKIVKPFTPANNSDEVARDTKSASGQKMHSREMPDIAARLEEIFKIPQSASRQSEVDILTQGLLKHWKGKETFDGIQNYIKSIPFRNEDPYDSDASDGIMIQKDSSSLNDYLRMRYNSSQDFAQDAPLLTEDPEKEVSRKQSAKEYALLATPTKRLRSESTSIVSESKAKKDQTMTGSDFNAKLDSIIRSDDTESRSSMPLQDNDDEDCDSDTSGSSSSYEEPERPPQQIRRKESKKRGGYIHPVESEKDRSEAGARITKLLDKVDKSVHSNPQGKRRSDTLYVGNVDYNASEQDLREALDPFFQRIRVDKITVPKVNGRSLYAFIEISWPDRAPVKTSDICINYNAGTIQVNSRPIYFRELRDKSAKK